ncbi:MAG: YdcF family protein [Candidatus Saganbacteria bacterium]|nr:YdcF family protein [Candidatus Saganbacteria bacterium]
MRRCGLALLLAGLVLLGACLLYPFILESAASWLIVRHDLAPVDCIIVLGGDNNGERVREAAGLYHQEYAPKVLLSGGPLAWELSAADWMKKQALTLGVPSRDILLEKESESTIGNALFSLQAVKKIKAGSVILVTSPTHSRRAYRVFNKVFGREGIKVISWPAREPKFRLERWWTRHEDSQQVLWEYAALVFYRLKLY